MWVRSNQGRTAGFSICGIGQIHTEEMLSSGAPWFLSSDSQSIKMQAIGASLEAQWLRICLPVQGTQVRALVWEDPTCRGATRPVRHNY